MIMKKIIMLKYAELNTKKDNINMFLKTLKNNIESKIKGFGSINYDKGGMFIYPDEERFDLVFYFLFLHLFLLFPFLSWKRIKF